MTLVLPAARYAALPGRENAGCYEWERAKSRCDGEMHDDADSRMSSPEQPGGPPRPHDGDGDRCCKRRAAGVDIAVVDDADADADEALPPPPKRISPYWNTPKQRKEERRRVLGVTARKLRQIGDPERCLHRAVLLNNTLQRVQGELRADDRGGCTASWARRARRRDPPALPAAAAAAAVATTPALPAARPHPNLFEDHFAHWCDADEKMAGDDALSDALARNVKNLIGGAGACGDPAATPAADAAITPAELSSQSQSQSQSQSSSSQPSLTVPDVLGMDTSMACSNLTEDERLVLGEMDAVFSNFLKVLSAGT